MLKNLYNFKLGFIGEFVVEIGDPSATLARRAAQDDIIGEVRRKQYPISTTLTKRVILSGA